MYLKSHTQWCAVLFASTVQASVVTAGAGTTLTQVGPNVTANGIVVPANKAVEMFHNKEFQGRQLTVNIARPREERAPRSGGGGGGGGGGFRGGRDGGRRERY